MKTQCLALMLLAPLVAAPSPAQTSDWATIQNIVPGTVISVTLQPADQRVCYFQKASDTELLCRQRNVGLFPTSVATSHEFSRQQITSVCATKSCLPPDYSAGFLALLLGLEGGGGWDSTKNPTSFAGIKMGGAATLDLQYDRLNGQNGFSVEGSGVLPLFRVPSFRSSGDSMLFKLYAEPGVGYRAGDGPFGGYSSAKVLVLLGDKWIKDGSPTPYIEFQRRFPFSAPLDGDNRVALGFSLALCAQCGVE